MTLVQLLLGRARPDAIRCCLHDAAMERLARYAWILVDGQGQESSVLITLSVERDAPIVAAIREAMERRGLMLVPVYPGDVPEGVAAA